MSRKDNEKLYRVLENCTIEGNMWLKGQLLKFNQEMFADEYLHGNELRPALIEEVREDRPSSIAQAVVGWFDPKKKSGSAVPTPEAAAEDDALISDMERQLKNKLKKNA